MFRAQGIKEDLQELKGIDKIKRRIIIAANKVLRKSPSTKENSNMNNVKDYDSLLRAKENEASSELEMRKNVSFPH